MPEIDLVFDADCPNVPAAREALTRALSALDLPPRWRERVGTDADLPEFAKGYGSPTVFVDGRDVAGAAPSGERCCRVYRDEAGGLGKAPTAAAIIDALRVAQGATSR